MPIDTAAVANKARNIMSWLKKGLTQLTDPEREQRVASQASQLQKELRRLMKEFDLDEVVNRLEIEPGDRADVCLKVFSNILSRAWDDGELTEGEAKSINWAANVLAIPSDQASEMKVTWGKAWFERHLAQAFEDGQVTSEEARVLNELATRLGTNLHELVHRYFSEESESFLRGVFYAVIEDGRVSDREWSRLIRSIELLGFNEQDFMWMVQPQVRQLVEHFLADAKSDGILSKEEDDVLTGLLARFELPRDFLAYVEGELWELRQMTAIRNGKLPVVTDRLRVECRAGEVVHLQERALYRHAKQRRGEIVFDDQEGWFIVTDSRFLFVADLKNFQVNLRSVIRCDQKPHPKHPGVEINCGSTGTGCYYFDQSARLAYHILKSAIGRANQTLVERVKGAPTRHIPRDIRQRIWQRYGGRCVQCDATTYLEFDHIIPVAKGGSNSEANIQLLCRKCNLTKSDEI